jgi:hypothetical protein
LGGHLECLLFHPLEEYGKRSMKIRKEIQEYPNKPLEMSSWIS